MKRAKAQAELVFAPCPPPSADALGDRGRRAWHEITLPIVRLAIDLMTHKEVAWLLGVSGPKLSDALAERGRKRFAAEWLVVLLVAAPEPVRGELVSALTRLAGYQAPKRREPLAPADELRARRRALERLAPAVAELVDREIEALIEDDDA